MVKVNFDFSSNGRLSIYHKLSRLKNIYLPQDRDWDAQLARFIS